MNAADLPPLLLPRPRALHLGGGWLPPAQTLTLQPGDAGFDALARDLLAPLGRLDQAAGSAGRAGAGGVRLQLVRLDAPAPGPAGDAAGGQESYSLALRPARGGDPALARACASTATGMRHALRTLAQLLVQYPDRLPALEIADAPLFAQRGVMLDISRDRVPTMAQLRTLIAQLGSWKINHLQLYTEHTFAYAGHEEVWRGSSPLTPDEVLQLDAWCAGEGIGLAANQNCLGHLARWLRLPRYAPLAEMGAAERWDFAGLATRQGPFSLCPLDPRALDLVDDLLTQLTPLLRCPLVNIGCDEAFDVGQGRSRAAVRARGRGPVYLDFVRQVCALVRAKGRRPQFWADIALEHPEALTTLPEDLVGLAWGYEPEAPFARWCDQLRSVGREVWVCPGTSCWRSITGRTRERRGNLLAAAQGGAGGGAHGYLVTAWGDLGHRQQWPVTLHALGEGAACAWGGAGAFDARASSLHAFADRSLALGPWLDRLGDCDDELRARAVVTMADGGQRALRNASALFTDLARPLAEPWYGAADEWLAVAARLDALGGPPAGVDALVASECAHTVAVARLAVERALLRRGRQRVARAEIDPRTVIIPEYRRLWGARSRPGGLEESVAHYQALADELAPGR
jgi:hexosaminidase